MSDLDHVLVLAGGLAFEREVSLRSGHRVADALRSVGLEVELADTDADLLGRIGRHRPDAVFIALHGGAGEDGGIRGVLELLDVPFVGAPSAACRMAFDKPVARAVTAAAGMAVPRGVALAHTTFRELGAAAVMDDLVRGLGLPLMVKPARGGSAMGVTRVDTARELPAALVHCYSYDDTAVVERYVIGTELAVSVLDTGDGPVALPPVEIVALSGVFDYTARYAAGATEYCIPARLPEVVVDRAREVAVAVHTTLGLRDLSRTDLIVGSDGTPWFLEVNVSPGMTETSLLPMAVAAAGHDLGTVCRELLQRAAGRRGEEAPVGAVPCPGGASVPAEAAEPAQ